MKSSNIIIVVVIAALALLGGWFLLRGQGGGGGAPSTVSGNFIKGQEAPEATLKGIDGTDLNLSDYRGKAVVLDFWAAWCPACVEEMPVLQAAQEKYGEELVMIGVHRTSTESLEKGKDFAEDLGVTYLLTSDPNDALYNASQRFGMPVAIFIDKEGVVQELISGGKTEELIEELIADII